MTPIRLSQPPTHDGQRTRIVYVNPDAIQRFYEVRTGGSVLILLNDKVLEVDESSAEIVDRLFSARHEATKP